ncbi:MAG: ABC transporter permease [Candidatus Omnitrophica bacterium]|nr:ABC transporter permease [Candidatus Omnitrophota bacterium]
MIQVKDLSKTYRMGKIDVQALRRVSLTICAGEFVAIMGPSGSGKSTLMHVLGLLDRPDEGTYLLEGQDVKKCTDDELATLRNKRLGFIFQQFHLLANMTAAGNVELPLIYAGLEGGKHEAVINQRLEEVGLKDRMQHRPNEMSGGQQQRVAIARSLVNDPLILFADEPTGNLDSKSKAEIIGILQELNRKGKTIIMVTHENEMAAVAKRVIVMKDGVIVSDKIQNGAPSATGARLASASNAGLADPVGREVSAPEGYGKTVTPDSDAAVSVAGGIKFWEYMKQAVFAMASHKMRTFLSVLGILIGVAAVIAMISLGRGAQDSIEKQLSSLGSNLLMIMPGSANSHGVSMQAGSVTRFTFEDVDAIAKIQLVIKNVNPSVQGRAQLVYSSKNWNSQVEGDGTAYETMRNAAPVAGRFFTDDEVKKRAKVTLIGATVARQLFGDADPIGETIKINLINFKVIGVLPARGASGWRDQDDIVIIPITTAMYRVLGKQYIDSIAAEVSGPEAADAAQTEIVKTVSKIHHLTPKEADDNFQVRNMSDIKEAMMQSTKIMSMLLGIIATISLIVGGIGIMNIMLVSVTERTREIGLRKAIGANNRDILMQFLIEAMLLSFLGGLIGVAIGVGVSLLIVVFAGWAVKISVFPLLLATTFSLIVGLIFGIWPAVQASKLNPIEALRYE